MDPVSPRLLSRAAEGRPQTTYEAYSHLIESLSTEDPGFPLPELDGYIDFNSPILTHLIDIEKKFWSSDTNKHYKLRPKVDDSESSIQSLAGVATYQLSSQNHRPQLLAVESKAVRWNERKSQDSNVRQRDKSSDVESQDPKSASSSGLHDRVRNRLKNMYMQTALAKSKELPRPPIWTESTSKPPSRKPDSPKKTRPTDKLDRDFSKKTVRDSSKKPPRETEGSSRIQAPQKPRSSYLRFESAKIPLDQYKVDPKKLLLKKMKSNLRGDLNSREKSCKSRDRIATFNLLSDLSKGKIQHETSGGKLYSKLLDKSSQKHFSTKELLSKIDSGFLGRQKKIFANGMIPEYSTLHHTTPASPKGNKTLRSTAGGGLKSKDKSLLNNAIKLTASKPLFGTLDSAATSLSKNKKVRKTKASFEGPVLGKSQASNFSKMLGDKTSRQTPNKSRISDKLKLADLEKHIFTSSFKHKVWSKVFGKVNNTQI